MGGCRPRRATRGATPRLTGAPGHVPSRPAVAADGKERKHAKAGGKTKVHLLAAITHVTGMVIGQT